MDRLFEIVLINAVSATALALIVAPVTRYVRRPAIVHALWLIVLLKLITPPVLEVGILPATGTLAGTADIGSHRVVLTEGSLTHDAQAPAAAAALPALPPSSWNLRRLVLALWLAGTAGFLSLAAVRGFRFHRLLGETETAPAPLCEITESLGSRLGLRLCPRLRVVCARISPMLWFPGGRLTLLFPRALLLRLSRRETDSLLTHELAHARRRDHWLRYVELLVLSLFWWHPLVWWARNRMRRAEEQCCDALVVRTLPDHARDYAEALLKTVEFLAGSQADTPALASGAASARKLEERLRMIMKNRTPNKTLSHPLRVALVAAAVAVLMLFPTWSDGTPRAADDGDGQATSGEIQVDEFRQRLRKIDLETAELKQMLERLLVQRAEIESELGELAGLKRLEHGEWQAAELELAGRAEEAARVREILEQHMLEETVFRNERERRKIEAAALADLAAELGAERDRLLAQGHGEQARELERKRDESLKRQAVDRLKEAELLRLEFDTQRAIEERENERFREEAEREEAEREQDRLM